MPCFYDLIFSIPSRNNFRAANISRSLIQNAVQSPSSTQTSNINVQNNNRSSTMNQTNNCTSLHSIFLNAQELSQVPDNLVTSLPANKIVGKYDTPEDYLRVHYDLLRYDTFSTIHDRIAAMKGVVQETDYAKLKYISRAFFYRICATGLVLAPKKPPLLAVFWDTNVTDRLRKQFAKSYDYSAASLKEADMVALSPDNFTEKVFYATVVSTSHPNKRDKKKSKANNCAILQFFPVSHTLEIILLTIASKDITMVAAPTLIMSILPLLENIQRAIAKDSVMYYQDIITQLCFPVPASFSREEILKINKFMEDNYLDPSQQEAFKMALSQQLSLIQGPPGTGKSHIARMLCKFFLAQRNDFKILLVTYKNLSLDHLCEGCLEFLPQKKENLLRLGSRSTKPDTFTLINDPAAKNKSRIKTGAQVKAVQKLEDDIKHLVSRITSVRQPTAAMLTTIERGSLMSNSWSNNPDDALWQEWLKPRKPKPQGKIRKDVFDDVLQTFGMERNDDLGEENVDKEQKYTEDILLLGQLNLNMPESEDISEDLQANETKIEEEADSKIWEEIDEKYELREETRSAMTFLRKADLIDLSPIFKALAKYQKVKPFVENVALWDLPFEVRLEFVAFIMRRHILAGLDEFAKLLANYEKTQSSLFQATAVKKADIASKFLITGATSSGVALNANFVNKMNPDLIIVEEAAELLEGSLVGSILVGAKSTRQPRVVFIGDHKQLCPKNDCYRLETEKNLAVSMFERLINNGAPCVTLTHQRRMHPQLTPLHSWVYGPGMIIDGVKPNERDITSMNSTRYPELFQHFGNFSFLPGLQLQTNQNKAFVSRKIFLAMSSKEERIGVSLGNPTEAKVVVSYAHFLVKHVGVPASKITILTPYKGQLFAIRKLLMTYLQRDHIDSQTVDTFQGEENDIIIMSMTRTNAQGFTKTQNRICVSVSRARCAFVMFGYLPLFQKNEHWNKVLENVDIATVAGDPLEIVPQKAFLFCPRHNTQLGSLYGYDITQQGLLSRTVCAAKCGVVCVRGHSCQATCHDCPGCSVQGEYQLECGHSYRGRCSNAPECTVEIEVILACSHKATKICSSPEDPICTTLIPKKLPCGHVTDVACPVAIDLVKCIEKCRTKCSAGIHLCPQTCHSPWPCPSCAFPIMRELECGHKRQGICGNNSVLACTEKIEKPRSCGHILLVGCAVDVEKEFCRRPLSKILPCGHEATLQCSQDTAGVQCNTDVKKTLPCDHTCITKCHHEPVCRYPVTKTLICGHEITTFCSAGSSDLKCTEKTYKTRPCGHSYKDLCCSPISPCNEPIVTTLPCGHEVDAICSAPLPQCAAMINTPRQCGHIYEGVCSNFELSKCRELVEKTLVCHHKAIIECSQSPNKVICNTEVDCTYPCGHSNRIQCYQRAMTTKPPCRGQVVRRLPCGHDAQVTCSSDIKKASCTTEIRLQHPACSCTLTILCHKRQTVLKTECPMCKEKHNQLRAEFALHEKQGSFPARNLCPHPFDVDSIIRTLNSHNGNFRIGMRKDVRGEVSTKNFMAFCSSVPDPTQFIRVLIPVKSIRFLAITLRRGFPPPYPATSPVCKLAVSKTEFDIYNRGKRLAIQCLVALGVSGKDFGVIPYNTKVAVIQEQYVQGKLTIELFRAEQILIEHVIEI